MITHTKAIDVDAVFSSLTKNLSVNSSQISNICNPSASIQWVCVVTAYLLSDLIAHKETKLLCHSLATEPKPESEVRN